MVSELRLYIEAEWLTQAQHYSAVLLSRGVQTRIETVEKLNARFLRLNPELALCVDAEGLWLCDHNTAPYPLIPAPAMPRIK